jgi:hypothetical protein
MSAVIAWAEGHKASETAQLLLQSGVDPAIEVDGKTLPEAATCTNPDRRVQADFEQTRRL